jgi:hypothetical protein
VSDTFGGAALRLAAHAARTLGWRPSEFWAATPAELATSLGLTEADPGAMLDRTQLQRLMDNDNDRPG